MCIRDRTSRARVARILVQQASRPRVANAWPRWADWPARVLPHAARRPSANLFPAGRGVRFWGDRCSWAPGQ
eukprot:2756548-Alexandrium_andersonii.AAC.1